jgi:REP element-mobilizing transposase RayT
MSGRSFEHRRQWIQDRMELLAGVFGIDVLAFAVMSNHLHVVLRNRPDVVASWSDEDVARRWWRLFPLRRTEDGSPAEMEEHDLSQLLSRKEILRARLSDVSWWMRCLAEGIARRANREDECTGRFWEGRFKCQPLLDESAVAACMAYVDLNPVRAGIAATPETSRYTSIYERLKDEQASTGDDAASAKTASEAVAPNGRAGWLAPVDLKEASSPAPSEPPSRKTSSRAKSDGRDAPKAAKVPPRRASDRGCLPLTSAEYAALLDWTGRQIRRGKTGRIAAELPPILERLQTSPEQWVLAVEHFRTLFRTAAGRPSSLASEATRRSRRWLHGTHASRDLFG